MSIVAVDAFAPCLDDGFQPVYEELTHPSHFPIAVRLKPFRPFEYHAKIPKPVCVIFFRRSDERETFIESSAPAFHTRRYGGKDEAKVNSSVKVLECVKLKSQSHMVREARIETGFIQCSKRSQERGRRYCIGWSSADAHSLVGNKSRQMGRVVFEVKHDRQNSSLAVDTRRMVCKSGSSTGAVSCMLSPPRKSTIIGSLIGRSVSMSRATMHRGSAAKIQKCRSACKCALLSKASIGNSG